MKTIIYFFRQRIFLWLLAVLAALFTAACAGETLHIYRPPNLEIFVTSFTGNGNLGSWTAAGGHTGLAAGDAICQARAGAVGLSGTYKAWLSDDNDDAYCRIHNLTGKKANNCGLTTLPAFAGPWMRRDGFPFGGKIGEILKPGGHVYTPVGFDENGGQVNHNVYYFTNTDDNGVKDTRTASCTNWTVADATYTGIGRADATTQSWTVDGATRCDFDQMRLLCMQTGAGSALPMFFRRGKIAFVTSTTGTGDLSTWAGASGSGIAAGDAICQARAREASLSNWANFKAWLSDNTTDAKNHITSDGPWTRLDGVKIANNKADLTDAKLFSSINVTETGTYLIGYFVWTGTIRIGTSAGGDISVAHKNCDGWRSASAELRGIAGTVNHAGSTWTETTPIPCNGVVRHLYCFED